MLATSTTATRWKKGGEKRLPKDCSEFQCIFITKDWNESHSEVIGDVVDIYDSAFGNAVVRNFFKAIDKNPQQ